MRGRDAGKRHDQDRGRGWQTPQVFDAGLIRRAYETLEKEEAELLARGVEITDDAMIVELLSGQEVYLVEGSYENIKVTTPDDLEYAGWLLAKKLEK